MRFNAKTNECQPCCSWTRAAMCMMLMAVAAQSLFAQGIIDPAAPPRYPAVKPVSEPVVVDPHVGSKVVKPTDVTRQVSEIANNASSANVVLPANADVVPLVASNPASAKSFDLIAQNVRESVEPSEIVESIDPRAAAEALFGLPEDLPVADPGDIDVTASVVVAEEAELEEADLNVDSSIKVVSHDELPNTVMNDAPPETHAAKTPDAFADLSVISSPALSVVPADGLLGLEEPQNFPAITSFEPQVEATPLPMQELPVAEPKTDPFGEFPESPVVAVTGDEPAIDSQTETERAEPIDAMASIASEPLMTEPIPAEPLVTDLLPPEPVASEKLPPASSMTNLFLPNPDSVAAETEPVPQVLPPEPPEYQAFVAEAAPLVPPETGMPVQSVPALPASNPNQYVAEVTAAPELLPPQQAIAEPPVQQALAEAVVVIPVEPTRSALLAPQLRHDGSPIINETRIAPVSHNEFLPPNAVDVVPTNSSLPQGVSRQSVEEIPAYLAGRPVGPDSSAAVLPPIDGPAARESSSSEYAAPADSLSASPANVNKNTESDSGWPELTKWVEPGQAESTFKTVGLLTILSLAPAILLMTTSFIRISVVLGLLRQAIGTQMLPSNQIVTSLAMFLTALVMMPVWQQVYDEAIVPYTDQASPMTAREAWDVGVKPVRAFMSRQIEMAQNSEDVLLFYSYLPEASSQPPDEYDDVPLRVLLPAFMISELKIAFLIGFQIYLPFLIIDLVVSSVTVSMGMMMLPPVTVSLPLKLLLFVLVDGWHLVVGMLLQSFGGFG